MSEIRGEKVGFRKKDIVALHALPSAQAHDPIIVHAPRKSSPLRLCAKIVLSISLLAFMLGAILLTVIESGMMDSTLNARARTALNAALGSAYRAEGSDWYVEGGRHAADYAVKLLVPGLGLARGATVGFRCAWDLADDQPADDQHAEEVTA